MKLITQLQPVPRLRKTGNMHQLPCACLHGIAKENFAFNNEVKIPHVHSTKACVDIDVLYSCTHFVISAVGESEWLTSRFNRPVRTKEPRCQLNWRLSGHFGEKTFLFAVIRTPDCPATSLVSIKTTLPHNKSSARPTSRCIFFFMVRIFRLLLVLSYV